APIEAHRPALGGRPTVGHVALDHGIGVRIPASQPISLTSKARSLGWSAGSREASRLVPLGANGSESLHSHFSTARSLGWSAGSREASRLVPLGATGSESLH